jgi:class 3 adenylate cyclase
MLRRCSNCGSSNPAGAKFCFECGAPLPKLSGGITATKVNAPSPLAEANGSEIFLIGSNSEPAAAGDERKTVTALFADIKGSTELMEDMDPEEARGLIDPALQLMINAARRFEGYVVQSTGDGVFILFGAPIAHEDDPQRAVYAALKMQDDIRAYGARLRAEDRPLIEIRVGINTGEVVVRSIRTGEQSREYTPIGHTTNLASRLQALAPTGSIVISENTARLVGGYFNLRPMGPVRLRGVSEPVSIYEVTGVGPLRTRLQAAARRGLSKFVGRQAELEQIRAGHEQARNGRGKLIAVIGEAGLGKSRLFHEFTGSLDSSVVILHAFAFSHGRRSSWLPVIGMLEAYFGISSEDHARIRQEKVTGKLLALDRVLDEALPYVSILLGIAGDGQLAQMDPEVRHRRILDAVTHILLRESERQPLVLVFEDLHWIDPASAELLAILAAAAGAHRMLLLVNYRPEYRKKLAGNGSCEEIRLAPLAQEGADELLVALLGDACLREYPQFKHLLIERTGGNPLFIEELVRALFEQNILGRNGKVKLLRPIEEVRIPPTIEAILAARIDRLPLAEKELLQTLAVLGREFTLRLVMQMTRTRAGDDLQWSADRVEELLARLRDADFIYEEAAWPESRYAFKHMLTQEVAYNSILSERRRVLHENAARAFETVFAGSLDEYVADLAHHHERSGNAQGATRYLVQAAGQAGRRFAYSEAAEYLRAGLKLLDNLPASKERDHLERDVRAGLCGCLIPLDSVVSDEVRSNLQRLDVLGEKLQDEDGRFWANFGLQVCHTLRLELQAARELGQRQLMMAERAGELARISAACIALARTLFTTGEFRQAQQLAERAGKMPVALPNLPVGDLGDARAMTLMISGSALSILGYPLRALELTREAVELARRAGPHPLALAMLTAAQVRQRLRESEGALEYAEALAALCIEHGFTMVGKEGLILHGAVLIQQGRERDALALAESTILDSNEMGIAGAWRLLLVEAYGSIGRFEEAFAQLGIVRRLAEQRGFGLVSANVAITEASLLIKQSGAASYGAAEHILRKAITLAQSQDAKLFELRASVRLAGILAAQGHPEEAHAILSPSYGRFSEGFETADLRDARVLLEMLGNSIETAGH